MNTFQFVLPVIWLTLMQPLVSPAKDIVLAIPMPPIEKGVGPTIVYPPHEEVGIVCS